MKKIAAADVSSYRMLAEAIAALLEWPDVQNVRRLRNHQFGISQPALSQIEKQKRPRKATLEKLALALGISVDQMKA